MNNPSANLMGCNDRSWYYISRRQVSCNNTLAAFEYSHRLAAIHEISIYSADFNFVWVLILCKSWITVYCLASCRKHKRSTNWLRMASSSLLYDLSSALSLPIVHIISQGPYISWRHLRGYSSNSEASIKGWTRLLNDQWALIIPNVVRTYFLMTIFNTPVDEEIGRGNFRREKEKKFEI